MSIQAAGDLLPSILTIVGLAIIVFATTNIDDILLLSADQKCSALESC